MDADEKIKGGAKIEKENPQDVGGGFTPTPIPKDIDSGVADDSRKMIGATDKQKSGGIGVSSRSERGFTKMANLLQTEDTDADNIESSIVTQDVAEKKEGVLLEGAMEKKTPVRDPLFAARILEQEREPFRPEVKETPSVETPAKEYVEPKIKRIRTYQGDIANTLKTEQTSAVQMVLAEHKRKQKREETEAPTTKKNLTFIVLSTTLAIVGTLALSAIAFYFIREAITPEEQPPIEVTSPIFSETKKEFNITGLSGVKLVEDIKNEVLNINIRLDFVEHLYFTEDISRADGEPNVKVLVTPQRFFKIMETKMPDSLLRSFEPEFMFGIHSFNGNQPFMVLNTELFESTFAGMLKWESFMASEMLPMFGVATTPAILDKKFEDAVVKNRDLRVLRDSEGEIILLYSFFNRNTLIISTDTTTLDEVVTRLNRPKGSNVVF